MDLSWSCFLFVGNVEECDVVELQLADIFEANIDDVMRRLGYCCGQRYEFTPLPRYCDSQSWCNIPVLVEYYAYEE